MKKYIAAFLVLLLSTGFAYADNFVVGTDYTVLSTTASMQKNVEVIELFNYGCPWCDYIETAVEAWQAKLPSNVYFHRVPLTFEQGWDTYAKAYYFAVALGIEPKITPLLFVAIHGKDDTQNNDLSDPATMVQFFVSQGVPQSLAQSAFSDTSPSMIVSLQEGPTLMKKYGINSIPTFIIIGKNTYKVTLGQGQAKSPQALMNAVNYLISLAK
jgi:thiol:disulfide interchange protein DsbA